MAEYEKQANDQQSLLQRLMTLNICGRVGQIGMLSVPEEENESRFKFPESNDGMY